MGESVGGEAYEGLNRGKRERDMDKICCIFRGRNRVKNAEIEVKTVAIGRRLYLRR